MIDDIPGRLNVLLFGEPRANRQSKDELLLDHRRYEIDAFVFVQRFEETLVDLVGCILQPEADETHACNGREDNLETVVLADQTDEVLGQLDVSTNVHSEFVEAERTKDEPSNEISAR